MIDLLPGAHFVDTPALALACYFGSNSMRWLEAHLLGRPNMGFLRFLSSECTFLASFQEASLVYAAENFD